MSVNQPEPGTILNFGAPAVPRPAATVILVRGGESRLELLLVKRASTLRFMGGAWVFPGGAVDPHDGDGELGRLAAARREVREEVGIELAPDHELIPFARWITPEEVERRFDTWFFVTEAPSEADAVVDGGEIVEHRWTSPQDALADRAAGELRLVFPTIKQLERLSELGSAAQVLAHARATELRPVLPRVVERGGQAEILLPGDEGYSA